MWKWFHKDIHNVQICLHEEQHDFLIFNCFQHNSTLAPKMLGLVLHAGGFRQNKSYLIVLALRESQSLENVQQMLAVLYCHRNLQYLVLGRSQGHRQFLSFPPHCHTSSDEQCISSS
jgi:hypothetical protein